MLRHHQIIQYLLNLGTRHLAVCEILQDKGPRGIQSIGIIIQVGKLSRNTYNLTRPGIIEHGVSLIVCLPLWYIMASSQVG